MGILNTVHFFRSRFERSDNRYLLLCLILSSYSWSIPPVFGQHTKLLPWQEGTMDIHHISTGRGNATFLVFPDGTTMIIDCGDMSETQARVLSERNTPLVPDHLKPSSEWVADYIYQFHPKGEKATIDYALITHFHDDHFGQTDDFRKKHNEGGFLLTGITELCSLIPIRKIIDRGVDFPVDLKNSETQKKLILEGNHRTMIETLNEYWKFIDFQVQRHGLAYEKFRVCSSQQFKLTHHPEKYPDFIVKNLFANGEICGTDGEDNTKTLKQGEYKGENELSTGIRISYGDFDYYAGGDIGGIDRHGQNDPASMETKTAPVIGPVEVATLNHHGNRGSMNSFFVSCLRPQVWIQQTWSADHPGAEVLRRITSRELYPEDRDVYTNAILKANKIVLGISDKRTYKSLSGHILIRVYPGGRNFSLIILDDMTNQREMTARHEYFSKSVW